MLGVCQGHASMAALIGRKDGILRKLFRLGMWRLGEGVGARVRKTGPQTLKRLCGKPFIPQDSLGGQQETLN